MARVTGAAKTLTLGGAAITGMTGYKFAVRENAEVVKVLTEGWTTRVGLRKGWTIDVDFELQDLTRDLTGTISAGGWDGAYAKEYTFSAEMPTSECSGASDEWEVHAAQRGADWKFSATKWEESASLAIFRSALIAQSGAAAFSAPFGTGTGILVNAAGEWNDEPGEETLDVECADATLTAGDEGSALITHFNTAMTAILSTGYYAGAAVVCSEGSGTGYLTKVEFKCPEGHLTGSATILGTGEFTETA